jgi:hypothetical protein
MEERLGTTRRVVLHGGLAVKFSKGDKGRRANLRELELWQRYKEHESRGQMLCPVLWSAEDGSVLIMKRAEPVGPDFDFSKLPDWDYMANGDDGCPWEPKAIDWGILDGRYVAVDYGNDDR